MNLPILYSFRRCPYAMRARMGLILSETNVVVREIILRDKPEAMLLASPKGTVPVLILEDGQVIDESLNIMLWGLSRHDPQGVLRPAESAQQRLVTQLIHQNDQQFKPWLDRYKYADRYPEQSQQDYYQQACQFLSQLEALLGQNQYLVDASPCLADYAIAPFIRQFAGVDKKRNLAEHFPNLARWLKEILETPLFRHTMVKYPLWQPEQPAVTLLS